jgi:hypothetical protein
MDSTEIGNDNLGNLISAAIPFDGSSSNSSSSNAILSRFKFLASLRSFD